jgi:hypothetical protein
VSDLTLDEDDVLALGPCAFWDRDRIRSAVREVAGEGARRARLSDALRSRRLSDGDAVWLACRALPSRAPVLAAALALHVGRAAARLLPWAQSVDALCELELDLEAARAGRERPVDERRARVRLRLFRAYRAWNAAGDVARCRAVDALACVVVRGRLERGVLFASSALGVRRESGCHGEAVEYARWRRHAARLVSLQERGAAARKG